MKTDFLMWRKRVFCFENQLSGVKKTVHCFRKKTPKNQIELNGIETIYIVVVLNFHSFFFNYSLFLFFLI